MRILMALCLSVPLFLLLAFAGYRWQQMHREAEERLGRMVGIAREHALKIFETNDAILSHILSLGNTPGADEAVLHPQLRELSRDKPQIQSIFLVGANARPIASDRYYPTPTPDVSSLDYMVWHRSGAGSPATFFTQLNIGRVSKEPFFGMSRALSVQGRPQLVALVSLRPSYFQDFHAGLSEQVPGVVITMFRSDGAVYSRWPAQGARPANLSPATPVMQRIVRRETKGAFRGPSAPDDQDRLIHFQQVGRYPVFLEVGQDLAAVRAEWWQEMLLVSGFGALPVALLMTAAYFAMRRSRELADASRKLGEEATARRQIEEALLQAQKLEALGRLTGGVAHDFNNALMVISGNLHLLRLLQQPNSVRFTDAIGRAVESATNLTRQLLAFSRRQPLLPQTVRLQERLPPVKDLLSPVLGSQIRLTVEVEPATPSIEVDMAEFELGLINLAVNARDAMPNGGTLRILARPAAAPPPGFAAGTEWVEVLVADTGAGMSAEVAAKAFDPFFTTKPVGQGTGLGLSQVYALCRRSSGSILLESVVGEGTSARLFFPAAKDVPAVVSEATCDTHGPLDLSVLLVEDNADVARAVQPVLEGMGCAVRHLPSADAALHWLQTQDALPDLLLTDVVMPGALDGLKLAQHVRDRCPQMRIVVMTGYSEQLDAIAGQGFQVLPKPWTAETLAALLSKPRAGTPAADAPPADARQQPSTRAR